jgi:drug/metabolite transporter (DMT)-like permease
VSHPPSRLKAILLALLITFIWSTSWIFIKIGLKNVPALTFAGLRYFIAFLCLLPFTLSRKYRIEIKQLKTADWVNLVLLGVVIYTLAQGGQYLALAQLPTVSVNLIVNLTSIFVAFAGIFVLKERPTTIQWIGVGLNLLGIVVYFYPGGFQNAEWLGLIFALICLAANIGGSLMGRSVNRGNHISPLLVTVISMGVGSVLLLSVGIIFQGLPVISLTSWGIILLLAVVNTAFSFTVWNYTFQTLTAMESSLINSTMLVQVAILSCLFLGTKLDLKEMIGLVLAIFGVLIVQVNFSNSKMQA